MSCEYIKVTRPKAERLFNEGVTLYLLPCKCSRLCLTEKNCWISPVIITKDNDAGRTFKKLVNEFEYYNCNREVGYYTHFYYVREDNKEDGGKCNEVSTESKEERKDQ